MDSSRSRPNWHVDLKWIVGIILVLLLSFTLVIYNLAFVTSEKIAVDTMSTLLASMFSPNGIDDSTDIDKVKQEILDSEDGIFHPFPGLKVLINKEDINTLTPRELRIKIFRQIAEPVYKQGAEGIYSITDEKDPELREKFYKDMGIMGVINFKNHLLLKRILIYLGIVVLLLTIALIYFSYGFGRLGNLGIIIIFASIPNTIIFTIASKIMGEKVLSPLPVSQDTNQMFGNRIYDALLPLVQMISKNYLIILGLGFGLVVVTLLAKLIWSIIRKIQNKDNKNLV